jgi:hypothetical protein
MPQSSIKAKYRPTDPEIGLVADSCANAVKHGLHCEWFAWFVSGIEQGMSPSEAANEASLEWDL